MRKILIAGAFAAACSLGLVPGAYAQQDVLAPALTGQLQCYSPDLVRKTCSALASYVRRNDGAYDNQAQVLIARDPVIIMTDTSPVTVRDGAVCGPQTDLAGLSFTINGEPASPEDSATLRAQLAQDPDFMAEEVCTSYTRTGDGLRAAFRVNGVLRENESAQVIWVRADEGYTVAP